MACVYDQQVFEKFRALAITEADKLVVGKTYFTNTYPSSFTVKEVITYGESSRRYGNTSLGESDKLGWIIPKIEGSDEHGLRNLSLADKNVGTSYNPWLIFETESLANACRECLPVQIINE